MKRTLVLALVLALVAVLAQLKLAAARPVAVPSLAESALTALGGFRSIAAEVVWFRADRLQEEGRYVELAQLAHALTLAEPHTPEVWSYAAWNLAYNISVMMPTPADRWRWVKAALRLLRDEGLRLNPTSGELHRELAWLFELKLGTGLDSAAPYYRERWRELVADVERRNAWEELAMERETMAEIERRYALCDRGDPLYSAVYWAYHGLTAATPAERKLLAEILRQSLVIYRRVHGEEASGG